MRVQKMHIYIYVHYKICLDTASLWRCTGAKSCATSVMIIRPQPTSLHKHDRNFASSPSINALPRLPSCAHCESTVSCAAVDVVFTCCCSYEFLVSNWSFGIFGSSERRLMSQNVAEDTQATNSLASLLQLLRDCTEYSTRVMPTSMPNSNE